MKAVRSLTIASNEDSRERVAIKLYKEDGMFVWRFGCELGDPVELFEPSKSVADAINNADAAWNYAGSPWAPRAKWLS